MTNKLAVDVLIACLFEESHEAPGFFDEVKKRLEIINGPLGDRKSVV